MRILLTILIIAAAALWWKREDSARFAIDKVPALAPYLATFAEKDSPAAAGRPAARNTPAVPVVVATAERRKVPITVDAVGTVQSVASIAIKPRIDSQISAIKVQEGALVREGDLLLTLDDRALKAQLAQAEALILKDRAQIEQVKRDLARAEELLAKRINTEVQRDTAATNVKVQEAQLAADRASRDNLATLLSYTEIRAPVSGRIGSIALKIGTTVRAADAQAIATVNQVNPIFVSFAVPQTLLGDLRAALSKGPVLVSARAGSSTVQGTVAFVENTVDLATGTVLAKAEMANGDEKLWPGTFVAVQATLGVQENAIAVPSAAVLIGQQGPYIFVVRDDRTAAIVPVTVERTVAGESVIGRGLNGGEKVVVDGQLRLVDGAPVQVQPPRTGEGGVATGDPGPAGSSRRS